jgi:uncharacterized protein YndB with AHSA1/START domain
MSVHPAPLAKPSLTLTRHLTAAPDRVYAAWTEPEKIARWFGPEKIDVLIAETDARVGGKFHIVMRGQDGEEHDVSGIYQQVVPNEKLVFSWAWRTTPERQSQVTVLIKPDGAGSLLTLIHEHFFDAAARDRHSQGWSSSLDKLERYLA